MKPPEVVAEPLENGLVLREVGNSDAYLYADDDTAVSLD